MIGRVSSGEEKTNENKQNTFKRKQLKISGYNSGAVVSNASQQEGSGFKSWLRPFCVHFA